MACRSGSCFRVGWRRVFRDRFPRVCRLSARLLGCAMRGSDRCRGAKLCCRVAVSRLTGPCVSPERVHVTAVQCCTTVPGFRGPVVPQVLLGTEQGGGVLGEGDASAQMRTPLEQRGARNGLATRGSSGPLLHQWLVEGPPSGGPASVYGARGEATLHAHTEVNIHVLVLSKAKAYMRTCESRQTPALWPSGGLRGSAPGIGFTSFVGS